MVALIVEGGVPTEVSGRDIHGSGDFVAVGTEQIPPRFCVIITEALGILPFEEMMCVQMLPEYSPNPVGASTRIRWMETLPTPSPQSQY